MTSHDTTTVHESATLRRALTPLTLLAANLPRSLAPRTAAANLARVTLPQLDAEVLAIWGRHKHRVIGRQAPSPRRVTRAQLAADVRTLERTTATHAPGSMPHTLLRILRTILGALARRLDTAAAAERRRRREQRMLTRAAERTCRTSATRQRAAHRAPTARPRAAASQLLRAPGAPSIAA